MTDLEILELSLLLRKFYRHLLASGPLPEHFNDAFNEVNAAIDVKLLTGERS